MQATADMYGSYYCFQFMEFVASVKINARGEGDGPKLGDVKLEG